MKVTSEVKKDIFKKYGGTETNTGSSEGQIILFTNRISYISEHLRTNKKDKNSVLALRKLVGKRKRLLSYLERRDINKYRELTAEIKKK